MGQKSIVKNYLYNLSYQILIIILPLVTASYLARVLGPKGNGIYIYTYTIVNYLKSIDNNTIVHIKFHPREKEHIRKRLLTDLARSNINYIILGNEVNIPVEYYLQYIHYEKVVMFLSSTSFYNGYLFPKVKFVSILKDYYNNCKAVGSPSLYLLEPLLKEIPKE